MVSRTRSIPASRWTKIFTIWVQRSWQRCPRCRVRSKTPWKLSRKTTPSCSRATSSPRSSSTPTLTTRSRRKWTRSGCARIPMNSPCITTFRVQRHKGPAFCRAFVLRRNQEARLKGRFHPLHWRLGHMQPRQIPGGHLVDLEILHVDQPVADRLKRGIRLSQYREQVLTRNRPIRRVNELPPPLHGLLHIPCVLGVFDQAVNETVHFALHGLIRN